ncbi:MAG: hypothetical protein N2038_10430 [Geminicoccaceae bacterium]|nr:hypothetical protein [Geminicoccaceae bacterium]MCS7267605.1 hypothetical protein [Geminicoccaceae bacterium]MCX7630655.1 hypothetical protein [Geminicoccaceae bacterium]MDW8123163.1 hypothetical protein [Geminicoccaceae bacterium]MDW8340177.1 hypothetical protein [Geminicoccaceae bacterium]
MDRNSLQTIWLVLRDGMLLAVLRAALSLVRLSVELLALDRAGREVVLARLRAMLLPDTAARP